MAHPYTSEKKAGAHVEAVGTGAVPGTEGTEPVSAAASQQPVEAAPADPTIINLYDVLVAVARADLHDYPGVKPNWYPSSFGKCDRAAVLERSGRKKNPTSDESALFFWIGNVIHDAIQKAVSAKLPGVVWHEVPVKDDTFHISGKMDTLRLVKLPDDSYEVLFEVYEYKSVRTNAFHFKMPFESHVLQVALYLTFPARCPVSGVTGMGALHDPSCGACGGRGVLPLPRRGRIAYIGKEDGMIKAFTVTNSPELREEVYKKLRSLEQQYQAFRKDGTMPDKLGKVPKMIKGVEQFYKVGNKKRGVKKGDPMLTDDHRTYNCDYKGQGVCCADKDGS